MLITINLIIIDNNIPEIQSGSGFSSRFVSLIVPFPTCRLVCFLLSHKSIMYSCTHEPDIAFLLMIISRLYNSTVNEISSLTDISATARILRIRAKGRAWFSLPSACYSHASFLASENRLFVPWHCYSIFIKWWKQWKFLYSTHYITLNEMRWKMK